MSKLHAVKEKFPVGKRVNYFPIKGVGLYIESVIRSAPWELGNGEIVIKIEGKAGGVCISHLTTTEGQ